MTEDVTTSAVRSLLDVVEELAQGLAHGQTPEPEWARLVTAAFERHRRELLTGEPEEEQ